MGNIQKTRFAGLGFRKIDNGLWRVVDIHDAGRVAVVGPQYKSKAELLADLERYARESWGYGEPVKTMGAYQFFYEFTRYGELHKSSCIGFGYTVTEAEQDVLTEAARAMGTDTTGFEITSVRAVSYKVVWNL